LDLLLDVVVMAGGDRNDRRSDGADADVEAVEAEVDGLVADVAEALVVAPQEAAVLDPEGHGPAVDAQVTGRRDLRLRQVGRAHPEGAVADVDLVTAGVEGDVEGGGAAGDEQQQQGEGGDGQ